jgi:hypothetical protein
VHACSVDVQGAETQTSIQLASHLVRAPNSGSGGHEFESPMRRESIALTKSGTTLGVRSFYIRMYPPFLHRKVVINTGKPGCPTSCQSDTGMNKNADAGTSPVPI